MSILICDASRSHAASEAVRDIQDCSNASDGTAQGTGNKETTNPRTRRSEEEDEGENHYPPLYSCNDGQPLVMIA